MKFDTGIIACTHHLQVFFKKIVENVLRLSGVNLFYLQKIFHLCTDYVVKIIILCR
jgi:hypothetical protein